MPGLKGYWRLGAKELCIRSRPAQWCRPEQQTFLLWAARPLIAKSFRSR